MFGGIKGGVGVLFISLPGVYIKTSSKTPEMMQIVMEKLK